MWNSVLKAASWSQIRQLLSSDVAELLPKRKLLSYATTLGKNYMSSQRFETALRERDRHLERCGMDVRIADRKDGVEGSDSLETRDGRILLELYFHQLFEGRWTLLDLRPDRITTSPQSKRRYLWSPGAFFVEWNPEFREAIQGIYTGFYEDEEQLFERSLEQIGMSGMSDIFREHFGFGNQREVTFQMETFRETFADVLSAAQDRGATIHPDFVGLGIYLTALYEHLETLGGAYDVRAAYQAATRRSSAA